jgi:hypothetical protein
MTLAINSRVTIAEKQLHGNQRNLIDGQVVALSATTAKVLIDHR